MLSKSLCTVAALLAIVCNCIVKAQTRTTSSSTWQNEANKSTDVVKAQRIERSQLKIDQSEKRAQDIRSEAERRCAEIKEEETRMIGDGRGPLFPWRAFRKASKEEILEAQEPYETQMKDVRADAERRIREVLNEGIKAAAAIEESAAHVNSGIKEYGKWKSLLSAPSASVPSPPPR